MCLKLLLTTVRQHTPGRRCCDSGYVLFLLKHTERVHRHRHILQLILRASIWQTLVPDKKLANMLTLVMATVVCVNLSDVQVITLDHEKYERELNNIAQGHSKSVQARDNMKLRAMGTADAAKCDLSTRLPKVYEALGEETGALMTT